MAKPIRILLDSFDETFGVGVVAPCESNIVWVRSCLVDPTTETEGIYLPLSPKKLWDGPMLDGYFQSLPKKRVGFYDPKIVEKFLKANRDLHFDPLPFGSGPLRMYSGWLPVLCQRDPGHPIWGRFYGKKVILVYPTAVL
jgi:hypothetical protein